MNVIVFAIAVANIILLIYVLITRSDHDINSEQLQKELRQHLEDESHRFAGESPFLSAHAKSWLAQQPESDTKPIENVTSSLKNLADQNRCPACGAIIAANDEKCPSCEISFVTDGNSFVTGAIQKWTPRTVGPADGIYRSPTEYRE
jgi:HPt (histidine-containing phosphotransfer) domain-containing protein